MYIELFFQFTFAKSVDVVGRVKLCKTVSFIVRDVGYTFDDHKWYLFDDRWWVVRLFIKGDR